MSFVVAKSINLAEVVVKSRVKLTEYRKVVISMKKPIEYVVERSCLAEHNKKLGSLIFSLCTVLFIYCLVTTLDNEM